ncbi:MAG: acetyltransferase [Gammaproteobacteria bacterium]|nr:acetyltransferase [Gammaproteobacteria bacterium]MBU2058387.1 acetyltransferase [Gammaproteobacteria bacterium]MBU2176560.1 acetyltransferase [Gammaproteobacteria bacterium]MBU2248498.1 acetyltransferase [Gammaproteobacteria bacterium]MBU2345639.1 acetyltransferase [Gammaproteobacteria bacterium]
MSEPKPLILVGAGGHAKVVLDLIRILDLECLAVSCPEASHLTQWRGLAVISDQQLSELYSPAQVDLVLGIGFMPGSSLRQRLFEQFSQLGYQFRTLCHPTAWVSASARLGQGCQVMAGAIIQADAECADNVIINTSASIDHDTVIGAHSQIAPGAVLCGAVMVDDCVFVGAAATVIQSRRIGKGAVVAAGAVVTSDVMRGSVVKGCPAVSSKPTS